jgi:UDP-glucose 4-epimerase
MSMRALVTGGLGYIGRAVTSELLSAGSDVTVLTRDATASAVEPVSAARIAVGDICDRGFVAQLLHEGRFDTIVHLAGLALVADSFARPVPYFEVNVGGASNLLHLIDELPVGAPRPSLIYASTTLVYGSRYVGAVPEHTAPAPESPYADTKVATERLIAAQANSGRLSATILRIFNVGGAVNGVGDIDPSRIIPATLRAGAGEVPHMTLVGDGSGQRDFVHVADVATAVRAAIDAVRPGGCPVYNIGSGVGSRIVDVLRCVEEVSGRTIPVRTTPEQVPPGRLIADISLANQQLGWYPKRSDLRTIVGDAWAGWPGRPGRGAEER